MKVKLSVVIIVLIILAIVVYYYKKGQQKEGDNFVVIPKESQRSVVPLEYFEEPGQTIIDDDEDQVTLV